VFYKLKYSPHSHQTLTMHCGYVKVVSDNAESEEHHTSASW